MSYDPIGALTGGLDGQSGPSATHTLALPVGAAAGDRVVIHSTALTSTATATIASGGAGSWTVLSGPDAGATGTGTTGYVWTKLLTSGDIGANIVVTWSASPRGVAAGVVYPPGSIGGVGTVGYNTNFGGTSTVTGTAVSAVNGDSLLLIGSSKTNSGGIIPTMALPAGYTQDKTSVNTAGLWTSFRTSVGHKAITSTGTAGADTITFSSATNGSTAYTIAMTPASPPNEPPTVSVIGNQNVAAGATVTVTSTAADADGSVASQAWSFDYPTSGAPALTGGTTAVATFTAGAAGSFYVLRCTVTDNAAATASATTEVRVPLVTATYSARPLPANGTGVGSWVNTGGAATEGAALADESDTTYLESPTLTATETNKRMRVQPVVTSTGVTIPVRLALDAAGSSTVKVRLFEGATLRQEWVQAITTTPTAYTLTVTTPGAIGDWGDLFLAVGATS